MNLPLEEPPAPSSPGSRSGMCWAVFQSLSSLPHLVPTFPLGPSLPDGLNGKKRGKSVSNLLYSEQWEGICISILSLS